MFPECFNADKHSIIYSFSVLSAALKAFLSLQHLIEIFPQVSNTLSRKIFQISSNNEAREHNVMYVSQSVTDMFVNVRLSSIASPLCACGLYS